MADAGPKSGKSDTTPEARQVQEELWRRMPLGRRLELVFDMYDTGQQLALAGLRLQHPEATEEELWRLWARRHLGEELFERVYGASKRA
jgi:hypothetical protein